MPLRTYSMGMNARLSFAISTAVSPDILLLDEGLGRRRCSLHDQGEPAPARVRRAGRNYGPRFPCGITDPTNVQQGRAPRSRKYFQSSGPLMTSCNTTSVQPLLRAPAEFDDRRDLLARNFRCGTGSNFAALTLLTLRYIPFPAIARTTGILLVCLALFSLEHFVGLGDSFRSFFR